MKRAFIWLIIVFLGNSVVMFWSNYDYYHVDKFFHFWGGFFVAMFFYYYLHKETKKMEIFKSILIIVSTVVLIGVLWEFFEYAMDDTIHKAIASTYGISSKFGGDLTDTLGDLVLDIIGGFIFSALHFFGRRNSHQA